jgi:2,3-bisphosphoglycerate-dependent phosphoglycerate mutase
MTTVVFETHSWSADNECGIATGWLPGRLSERGRAEARRLGERHRDESFAAVFASDLERAAETARIAFGERGLPVMLDWRLRECDYGALNGHPVTEIADKTAHLHVGYPGGESWHDAIARTRAALIDISTRRPDDRVMVIGHMATYYGCLALARDTEPEDALAAAFTWQPGWTYNFCSGA